MSTLDRCMICAEGTLGSKSFWAQPMVLLCDLGQVETHFVLLRDVDATDVTRFVLLPSVVPKMIFRSDGTFGANRAPILHRD
jgi:hypothetical protein